MTSQLDPGAFAELLAGYCLEVQPGQQVLVRSTTLATPLLLELQRAILARDAWPHLRVELPGQGRVFYEHARDRHLDDAPDLALARGVVHRRAHDTPRLIGRRHGQAQPRAGTCGEARGAG